MRQNRGAYTRLTKLTIKLLSVTKWIGDRVPSKEKDLSILFGKKKNSLEAGRME